MEEFKNGDLIMVRAANHVSQGNVFEDTMFLKTENGIVKLFIEPGSELCVGDMKRAEKVAELPTSAKIHEKEKGILPCGILDKIEAGGFGCRKTSVLKLIEALFLELKQGKNV